MGYVGGGIWKVEAGTSHLLNVDRAKNVTDLRNNYAI